MFYQTKICQLVGLPKPSPKEVLHLGEISWESPMNFRYQPEKNIQLKPNITGWWLTYPSEKYESVGKYIYSQYDGKVIKFHGSSHHQPDQLLLGYEFSRPPNRRPFGPWRGWLLLVFLPQQRLESFDLILQLLHLGQFPLRGRQFHLQQLQLFLQFPGRGPGGVKEHGDLENPM